MSPRLALRFLLASILAFSPLVLPSARGQDDPAPEEPPEEGEGLSRPAPPAPTVASYIETLERFREEVRDESGIQITTSVIPDLYLYGLARSLEEAKKNGVPAEKLDEHMRAEHKKLKKGKEQRILVRVEVAKAKKEDHLFLQKKPESHLKVEGEGKVWSSSDGDPAPRFDKWQIVQGASMKSFTLARFETLRLQVEVRKKSNESCRLQFVDLLRYVEVPKKSEYETKGINVDARQISLGSIRDMVVDPISIELAPATWEPPPVPAELEEWRKKLDPAAGAPPRIPPGAR